MGLKYEYYQKATRESYKAAGTASCGFLVTSALCSKHSSSVACSSGARESGKKTNQQSEKTTGDGANCPLCLYDSCGFLTSKRYTLFR